MRIRVIDVANPVAWEGGRELWPGGPRGWLEHQFHTMEALARRGHDVTLFGQTRDEIETHGFRARPLTSITDDFDWSLVFWGRYASAPWAPFQFDDAHFLQMIQSLQGPTLFQGYRPLNPVPIRWPSKKAAFLAFSRWHRRFLLSCGISPTKIKLVGHPIHESAAFDENLSTVRSLTPMAVFSSFSERGLDALLKLWPTIRSYAPSAELYVAGKNPGEKPRRGVHFLGEVSEERLKWLYHHCWAILYPADADVEVFGHAVVKAQLAGCVPVVTPCGALPESIVEGGGYIVEPESFATVAGMLLAFKNIFELRTRKCREIKTISPDLFARRLEKCWSEL